MGFDYKFGHHRTDVDYLARNFSGTVHVIEEQQSGGEKKFHQHGAPINSGR